MPKRTVSNRAHQWLVGELETWRREEILSPDQSSRILALYQTPTEAADRRQSLAMIAGCAERFAAQRPTGGTFLRGTIDRWDQIQFGIESFYVQEGTGLKYERAVRQRRLYAKVAVGPSGQAVLRGLQIEP